MYRYFGSILFLILFSLQLGAQGTNINFGQNRVQYKDFEWNFFKTDHFKVYSYTGGKALANFTAQSAEKNLEALQKKLDYLFRKEMDIIVFNDQSDLNQSNIGLDNSVYNTGGQTKIIGNKIFLYFNGSHAHLEKQIRQGLGKIMLSSMMFGGNVQEILQNAVLLNLPEWFTEGVIAYSGESWNSELDDRLRDALLGGKFEKLNHLTGEDARLVGHGLFHYISEIHGQQAVPNLIYLTRVNRSVENGFLFVLGSSVNQTVEEWRERLLKDFANETKGKSLDEKQIIYPKLKGDQVLNHLKISPNGKYLSYVTHYLASWKVHLYDLEKGKDQIIYKGGYKTRMLETDYSYPLVAFSPNSRRLGVIFDKKDVVRMLDYDIDEGKKDLNDLKRFTSINSFNYMDDPKKIVLSANRKGQSDIFVYKLSSGKTEQITNDYFDDLYPAFVNADGRRGIAFSSNRFGTELETLKFDTLVPITRMDIFYYPYNKKKVKELTRITQTPLADERYPAAYNNNYFSFLSDENGVYNRYLSSLDSSFSGYDFKVYFKDSTIWNPIKLDSLTEANSPLIDSVQTFPKFGLSSQYFPASDMPRNIVEQDVALKKGKTASLMYLDGRPLFYIEDVDQEWTPKKQTKLEKTAFWTSNQSNFLAEPPPKKENKKRKKSVFQNGFEPEENSTSNPEKKAEKKTFQKSRSQPYRLRFSVEQLTTQLDNSLFVNKYQNFNSTGGVFLPPQFSGLITFRAKDVLEDKVLEGGFRLPMTFTGTEFFMSFKDRRKRLDKEFLFYRKTENQPYSFAPAWPLPVSGKIRSNFSSAKLKYPLDVIRSVSASLGYRDEKVFFKSEDTFSLSLDNFQENWLSTNIDYIHDNTIELEKNIPLGTKFKVYWELHKKFSIDLQNGLDVEFDKGFLNVIGFDGRHYQRLHRNIIWANRFAAASSSGNQKLIYYLGGVDNWLFAKFNDKIFVDQNAGYAFQTLATNMRGFPQNIRNGNSHMVFNSEVRVPVFSYLFNRPIRSEFFKNLQVVGFADVGTAWQGKSPFGEDNPFNELEINKDPVSINIKYFRNPVVAGYGFGFRTVLLGYFARVDFGWGLDTGVVGDRQIHFSLGLDF